MDLKKEYDRLNKLYFGNKLPRDMVVEWSSNIPDEGVASTHPHGVLKCQSPWCPRNCKASFIRLSPILSLIPRFAEWTLLHEMGHAKALLGNRLYAYHGKLWTAEMHRLIRLGAFDDIF